MLKFCKLILFVFSGQLYAQSPACGPVLTLTSSENSICSGNSVWFHVTVTNQGTQEAYKWKRNNKDAGVNNTPDYSARDFHDGDIVTCTYSCQTTCGRDTTVTSNPVTIHVFDDITPTLTISNVDTLLCEGERTVFTTKASYGNEIPVYQWMVNGSPVGTNSPTYTTDSLTNGSTVYCTLTISTPSCPGTKSSRSQITIYVYPMIHPAIKIIPSATQICRGEEVSFTATANGGPSPSFSWEINGIPTGVVDSSFSSSTLRDGDSVSCTITISQDSRCHTATSAPSNKVGIHVKDYKDPVLTIAAPDLNICSGAAVTFTATDQNAGDFKIYQWQVNGQNIENNSSTFTNNQFKNGDKVACRLTTNIPGCAFNATITSNTEAVTVRELPEITISSPQVTVMSGESAQLQASVLGNTASFVWTPVDALVPPLSLTPTTVPLTQDTNFTLTVVNTEGCTASGEIVVKVLRRLYMPTAFTPNNDGKNDVFRIPPETSIQLEEFSVFDRWGNILFRTSDMTKGWNGTYQGRDLNPGTYIYLIKGIVNKKRVVAKGTVTLIR